MLGKDSDNGHSPNSPRRAGTWPLEGEGAWKIQRPPLPWVVSTQVLCCRFCPFWAWVAHLPLQAHMVPAVIRADLRLSVEKGAGYISGSWAKSLARACPPTAARVGPDFLLQDPTY